MGRPQILDPPARPPKNFKSRPKPAQKPARPKRSQNPSAQNLSAQNPLLGGFWAGFGRLFGRRVSAQAHLYVLSIEVCTKGRPTSTKGRPTKWAETRPRISKPAQSLGGFWATFGRLFGRAGFRPSPSLIFCLLRWGPMKNLSEKQR